MPADSDVPLPPNPLLDDIARGHHHHPHHFKATTTTPGKLVLHSFRGYGTQNSKEHFAKGLKSQLLALKLLSSDKKISSPHRYRHHHEKQQKVRVKRDHYATKRTLYGESNISDLESLLHPNNVGKPFEDPTHVGKDDPFNGLDTSMNAAMMNPVEGSSRYSAGNENAIYHESRKDDYNEKSKDVSVREHLQAEGYHGDIKQDASDLGYIKEASYHDKMKDHKDIKEKNGFRIGAKQEPSHSGDTKPASYKGEWMTFDSPAASRVMEEASVEPRASGMRTDAQTDKQDLVDKRASRKKYCCLACSPSMSFR